MIVKTTGLLGLWVQWKGVSGLLSSFNSISKIISVLLAQQDTFYVLMIISALTTVLVLCFLLQQ